MRFFVILGMRRYDKKEEGYMIGVIIVSLIVIVIILSLRGGKLPRSGYPNGISERKNLEIDNGVLGLVLLSDDINNPVLLVCGGGPGIPQYLLEAIYASPLKELFTVCYWDYRGTGASFDATIKSADMTTERYLNDLLAVTDYLSQRFSQDKIYIMGHSFGTYLALKAAQAYPDKYKCYIAMSQICNQNLSEYLAFDDMLQQYKSIGNKRMLDKLEKYDIRQSSEDYNDYFFSGLRDKAMHDLGVGTTRTMHSVITGIFFPSLSCRAYTRRERINIWRGKALSAAFPVTQDAVNFNAFDSDWQLKIPIYFFIGRYDYTCYASLQQEFYESIEAPQKGMYIFENSAHSPIYEEHERGKEGLREIISCVTI